MLLVYVWYRYVARISSLWGVDELWYTIVGTVSVFFVNAGVVGSVYYALILLLFYGLVCYSFSVSVYGGARLLNVT